MWVDELELTLTSGNGGDGVVSFRHEKGVEFGGPNGGNGGDGGDVIVSASKQLTSLLALKSKKKIKAENGDNGKTYLKTGKFGKDLIIKVPVGTVIRRASDNAVIADLYDSDSKCIIIKGGRGGRGNAAFATSVNQSPKFRELGEKGKTLLVKLELRMIADAGMVGLPNAGKSTLLSRLSSAKPKIADYPFTTLEPMLGVVKCGRESFTLADMPGLIKGAHKGKGLGIKFLKHIERTRLLLHLVDSTSQDPESDFNIIREELELYGHGLSEKQFIVLFTKIDCINIPEFSKRLKDEGIKTMAVSSVSGKGLDELKITVSRLLEKIPPVEPLRSEITEEEEEEMPVAVRKENNLFIIEGSAVKRYLERRNPSDIDGWRRFWNSLIRWGVAEDLKNLGIKEGDTVKIGSMELEYWDEEK